MLKQDFKHIVQNCPVYYPIFKINRVPNWAAQYSIKKGDLFYYHEDSFVQVSTEKAFGLGHSCMSFVRYSPSIKLDEWVRKAMV